MKVSEYLQKTREERTAHVDLNTPCVLTEIRGGARAKAGRKALLTLLSVENDIPDWRAKRVCCGHLCENNSKNGWCTNPLHLYIGTYSENSYDIPEEVRTAGAKRAGKASAREKDKLGRAVNAVKAGEKGGAATSSQAWVSLHDGFTNLVFNVSKHNTAVGADPNYRVQLTRKQMENYTPLLELFDYTTHKRDGSTLKGRAERVPDYILKELREEALSTTDSSNSWRERQSE